MTMVTAQMSVSLDGFYAGPEHTGDGSWLESAESAGFFRISRWVTDAMAWRERQGFTGGEQDTNSEIVAETFAAAGAYVMGRRMADGGEVPWGEEPPFRAPVFVVTHRPRETLLRRGAPASPTSPTESPARSNKLVPRLAAATWRWSYDDRGLIDAAAAVSIEAASQVRSDRSSRRDRGVSDDWPVPLMSLSGPRSLTIIKSAGGTA